MSQKPNKILTSDICSIATRSERSAVSVLQDLIPKLSESEKITLSLLLTNLYSQSVSVPDVSILANSPFGKDLTTAVLQIQLLSPEIQLTLAIELLEKQAEDEYGERWGPPEEEDLTRAIAEVNSPQAENG